MGKELKMNKLFSLLVISFLCFGCASNKYTTKMDNQIKKYNLQNHKIVGLVDYDKSIFSERFYIVSPKEKKVLFKSKVGHAYRSGLIYANDFSNTPGSNKSSLGLYKVGIQYSWGKFGTSLKLHGLSKTNSNVYKRAVVLHGCNCRYSAGCLSFDYDLMPKLLKILKKGTRIIVYK